MRAKEIRHRLFSKLREIRGQLIFGVAPSEIRVGLREPDLRQPVHHRRPRERFSKKDHVRVARADIFDQPLPERQRLGVGIVHSEDAHPLVDPEPHNVPQRLPERRRRTRRIERDVDDILVFLRRVLRIADRAIGPPFEPFRMLADPRVVRRTLDREIKRNLDPLPGSRVAEPAEVFERAERRMDRVMSPFVRADRIGAARILGQRLQRVVPPLAMDPADRMDRRE